MPAAAGVNKGLLPVGSRSVITKIIDWFPQEVDIVIAVGHEARKVEDFVGLACPTRKVRFVLVDKFVGAGAGPGYSLLSCRDHLQTPFVLVACDTLVLEPVPAPTENWIGVAKVTNPESFLVAEMEGGLVTRFFDKMSGADIERAGAAPSQVCKSGFIGLAGIRDYQNFWDALSHDNSIIAGELQTSNGLSALIDEDIKGYSFTWFDTGTDESYHATANRLGSSHFLEKSGEFVYFERDLVIKYFSEEKRAQNRVVRATHLEGVVPKVVGDKPNYLAYRYIPGSRLSDNVDPIVFTRFLNFAFSSVWKPLKLDAEQTKSFREACMRFYRDKTFARINKLFEISEEVDGETVINGELCPSLGTLLEDVDWEALSDGFPVLFHGDPQPENIIVTNDHGFVMVDWREDFGGLLSHGDLYYDLGKMHHALIVAGEIIRNKQYRVSCVNGVCEYEISLRSHLIHFLRIFEQRIMDEGLDLERVRLMSALVLVNIAPLHHFPYSQFLLYHGKHTLKNILEGKILI